MNTNNENTPNTDAISAQPSRDAMHCVSTNNNVSATFRTISAVKRGLLQGMAIALGFFGTTILGVAISGTIKTWTSGEVLKSADLNTTISSMKTAIESIPNWTKAVNGTDAYYTDGKVGIGTSSPQTTLDVASTGNNFFTLTRTNKSAGSGEFSINVESNSQTSIMYDSTNSIVFGTSSDPSAQTGYSEKMRINPAGNVGIGINNPTANLHVVGTTLAAVWSTSDERYKKNIQTIESPMDKILKLRGVNYEWRHNEFKDMKFKSGKDIGFIGQEVEKILPEVILKDDKGYISVAYSNLLPVVVEALKELKKDHDLVRQEKSASDKKISALEADNKRLHELVETLNASVGTHGRASLRRLEDRLNALERMQMAAAHTATAKK